MGTRNGPYNPDFPKGTRVRIAPFESLKKFARPDWKYHHPIQDEQLPFAGREAIVIEVAAYHGGDELYTLQDIPGIWHEQCLMSL